MTKNTARTTRPRTSNDSSASELPTFLEHLHELRRRLFWVVAFVVVASAAAYPFRNELVAALSRPLGNQQLYYLTPVGGFSFSIKLCMYAGLLATTPIIVYHLYRYLEPLLTSHRRRSAIKYVGLSTLLAGLGLAFAYFVSLPAALHFLTGLNLENVQALLTVDSYFTFVMTYLLGAALLFQIPLLMAIINRLTPLQPRKLFRAQRYVIVAAFILAAILSPTPDITNQFLLALPIIAMYQIGITAVWLQNRRRGQLKPKPTRAPPEPTLQIQQAPPRKTRIQKPPTLRRPPKNIDGFPLATRGSHRSSRGK